MFILEVFVIENGNKVEFKDINNYTTFIQKVLPISAKLINNLVECESKNDFEKLNEKVFKFEEKEEKDNKKIVIYFKNKKVENVENDENDENDDDIIIITKKVNKLNLSKSNNKTTNKKIVNKHLNLEFIQERLKNVQELKKLESEERQIAHYEDFENYYKRLLREIS